MAADHVRDADDVAQKWSPTNWWRVITPDGTLWCETRNEQEARQHKRRDDRLERLYVRTEQQWVPETQSDGPEVPE